MTRFKEISIAIILSALTCSICYAEPLTGTTPAVSPQIAVGDRTILLSNNDKTHWTPIPADFGNGSLDSVNCDGNTCISIGLSPSNIPLILNSVDGGKTWIENKNISSLPGALSNAKLFSIKCVGKVCNISGNILNENSKEILPLLLHSEDYGQYWTYTIPDFPKKLGFESYGLQIGLKLDCAKHSCIAVGWFESKSQSYRPVLFTSQDLGRNWKYKSLNTILPDDIFRDGMLTDVSCENNYCVAVGSYMLVGYQGAYPLILTSRDGGLSWHMIKMINGFPLGLHLVIPTTVNCKNNSCIIGGGRMFLNMPVLFVSNDAGITWTYKKVPISLPTSECELSILSDSSCEGNNCVAIGAYDFGPPGKPTAFLISSHDKGNSWTHIKNILHAPADLLANSMFNAVNCIDKTCIVAGGYFQKDQDKTIPIILLSKNGGASWEYINTIPSLSSTQLHGLTGSKGFDFVNMLSLTRRLSSK